MTVADEFFVISTVIILSVESVALGLVLFPLPRAVWYHVHRLAFIDERPLTRKIKSSLRVFLICCTFYAFIVCFESLARIIYYSLKDGRNFAFSFRSILGVQFFVAVPAFAVSLALRRTLYIVLTHLKLQQQLRQANGKAVQEQPLDLSSDWLYKPRTVKEIKDGICDTIRSSLGRIRLDSDSAESGSGIRFRDEIIARQEREIADLRRVIATRGPVDTENISLPAGVPGPLTDAGFP
ncbi:hypothetical protein PM082_014292 [Marasmius tenuissimus]|nr:hypothetical protein PM082_014292 [Marasmius tenuissimus]